MFVNRNMYNDGKGGYVLSFDEISGISRDLTYSIVPIYRIFRHIKDNGLRIVPNDCTLINMQLQEFAGYYRKYIDNTGDNTTFDEFMNVIINHYPKEKLLIENIK